MCDDKQKGPIQRIMCYRRTILTSFPEIPFSFVKDSLGRMETFKVGLERVCAALEQPGWRMKGRKLPVCRTVYGSQYSVCVCVCAKGRCLWVIGITLLTLRELHNKRLRLTTSVLSALLNGITHYLHGEKKKKS